MLAMTYPIDAATLRADGVVLDIRTLAPWVGLTRPRRGRRSRWRPQRVSSPGISSRSVTGSDRTPVSAPIFVGIAFGVGVIAALGAMIWLRGHRYRLAEEAELPARSRVWVALVSPILITLVAAGLASRWPWWVAVGPICFVIGWPVLPASTLTSVVYLTL